MKVVGKLQNKANISNLILPAEEGLISKAEVGLLKIKICSLQFKIQTCSI